MLKFLISLLVLQSAAQNLWAAESNIYHSLFNPASPNEKVSEFSQVFSSQNSDFLRQNNLSETDLVSLVFYDATDNYAVSHDKLQQYIQKKANLAGQHETFLAVPISGEGPRNINEITSGRYVKSVYIILHGGNYKNYPNLQVPRTVQLKCKNRTCKKIYLPHPSSALDKIALERKKFDDTQSVSALFWNEFLHHYIFKDINTLPGINLIFFGCNMAPDKEKSDFVTYLSQTYGFNGSNVENLPNAWVYMNITRGAPPPSYANELAKQRVHTGNMFENMLNPLITWIEQKILLRESINNRGYLMGFRNLGSSGSVATEPIDMSLGNVLGKGK